MTSVLVFTGYAIPSFVFGLVLIYSLGAKLDLLPISGFVSDNFEELNFGEKILDLLAHTLMPTACYMIGSFAYLTLLVKNSFLENISAPFVRTAVAIGLPLKSIFYRHILRNSLIPVAATFGQTIGLVLTGSFLIEKIFNIDGLGLLGYQSVVERDYPLVMGILYLSSLLFLFGNILSDICLALVDPRIRFSGTA